MSEPPREAEPAAPVLPREFASVLAVQRSAGNAAVTAMLARTRAPVRLLQREPDEEKIKQRAYDLWVRKGSPEQTREQADADYFEAQRQVRVEERAYTNYERRTGGNKEQTETESTADYYEAERQLAAEAQAAAPSVEQAVKEAEVPKDRASVEEPEPEEEKKEEPRKAEPAPAKYIPPHKQGKAPIIPVAAPAPGALPEGWLPDAQLKKLGFDKKQGRWQKNLKGWYGFEIHISVNPEKGAFNEFHVKFDKSGSMHRVYYFYDVNGKTNWEKSTKEGTAKAALKADGVKLPGLADALKEMDRIARAEADTLVAQLH